ncbi:hypothetical protein ONZ43_g7079 [Nemania bipapillata]|uniref:Uncharacterized protein n=1 Tax=Nemania bipapillata TaxID=110536 RepID=A0ACC2HU35_9PEZI|nr:hypothetical protein ONZ43_g7079 [Nemania bipapillata]
MTSKTVGLLWDATQSAVKEQRKKLKSQSKKPEPETDLSPGDTHTNVNGHTATKTKASAFTLSSEQQQIIDLVVKDQRSVFFTGPAGTGKSVLMRAIISELKKKWARDPERLSVTASTGLAACNIGGQTLHSFAGIGLGKEDVPTLVKKIRRNAKAKNRWLRTKTLIIDEVSMVDGELFDKLSLIARTIRNNEFADMLNEMRLGRISDHSIQTFKELARPLTFDDGLDVTELFPTRQEVERSNESRLRSLSGETYHYDCVDSGDANIRDKLLANMMAPKSIDLKKGAQVMLIKNMDDTLVNGSLGKLEKKIKAFSRDPENMKDLREYPVIRFTTTDGTHRVILCTPEDWKVELPTGEVQASRKQLPLILAWALSIHKAQGQTLERVKVDLGKVFEKGQAYVALSRAVSKNGLQVLRFEKSKVMAHPRVVQFYNKLYSAESAIKTKKTPTISDFVHQGAASVSTTRRKGMTVVDLDEDDATTAAYSR